MSEIATLAEDTFDKLGTTTEEVRDVRRNLENIGQEILNEYSEPVSSEGLKMGVSRVSPRGESSPRSHMWVMFARDVDGGFPELIHPEILVGEDEEGPYAALRFNAESGRDAGERDRLAQTIASNPSGFVEYLQQLSGYHIEYTPSYRDEISKPVEEVTEEELQILEETGLTSLLISKRYRPADGIFSSDFIETGKTVFHNVFFPLLLEYTSPDSEEEDLDQSDTPDYNGERTTYFILKTGSDEYSDVPSEHYHFKEGIPGSKQIRDAERVEFVYLEDGKFYAKGEIGDIESEDRDGETHYFAEVDDYEEIDSVDFDEVRDLISPDFPKQYGIIKITEHDYRLLTGTREAGIEFAGLFERVSRAEIYRDAIAHLAAGKSVVFYGPPGTGKTRTARILCEAVCEDFNLVTANAEWSNYEVVGGYRPEGSEWKPNEGILTESARKCSKSIKEVGRPNWLIIDELNRANLDQAFGQVFTLLDIDYRSKQTLDYADKSVEMPLSFRILATMNTYDRAQLFSLGYAFMRRFAFVDVPSLLRSESANEATSSSTNHDISPGEFSDVKEIIEEETIRALSRGTNGQGVSMNDVSILNPEYADEDLIRSTLEELKNNPDLSVGELDFLDVLLGFASVATESEIVEIGQALVMDATKYVVAYRLLFPDEFNLEVIDHAAAAYYLPQFDFFMPKLRKAQTIERDSDAAERFYDLISIARSLGLSETAHSLEEATEELRVL